MELVELTPLSGALVGLPGVDGLSTEQRKRLTIAVELVANPSMVFMDEPTSGLDARAAAIVMRTVRNIVNTGRTIVCTIHQPSIDIFESFDEVVSLREGTTSISFKIENWKLCLIGGNIASPSLPLAYFYVDSVMLCMLLYHNFFLFCSFGYVTIHASFVYTSFCYPVSNSN
jgi:energy-coupling factor transporter ATP-binding protein EcfA2